MGTRSLTFVYEESFNPGDEPEAIINMYRQYDGYPTGHGRELAEFLAQFNMVNGIPVGEVPEKKYANGMACLAAQMVAHFKDGAGQFYLYPTSAKECGQDYEYHIYKNKDYKDGDGLRVAVTDRGCNMFGLTMSDRNDVLFDGNLGDFMRFCTEEETA
jgi:hypothetical protein